MISPNNQVNLQNINQQQVRLSNAYFIHGGRDAAANYPVQPGYEAFMIDEEKKMFFIKTNNPGGQGFVLREFTYEEVTPKQNAPVGSQEYATKEDLNMVLEEIRKLREDKGHHTRRNVRRSRHGKSYDD